MNGVTHITLSIASHDLILLESELNSGKHEGHIDFNIFVSFEVLCGSLLPTLHKG